eukprot:CAMPEP_0176025436 /NCGR_PEP_ID=MMETSP0120_2-20121206/12443_1 /TAXON_ID=160619 /ORGANISM="Kryptoperidinium foliaceum, Strain CCMP 1326" /LENGTH=191 /DNA_ID=CAMNT_0017358619 /DNA_START=53 /DNA_END=628 /DNA_ORIENTATION=-
MGCACTRADKFDRSAPPDAVRPGQNASHMRMPVSHAAAGRGAAGFAGRGVLDDGAGAGFALGSRAEVPGAPRHRHHPRGMRHHRGPIDRVEWVVFDQYTEGLNEQALQEAIESSKKQHLLGELPREKFERERHLDLAECELCLEEYKEEDELLRLPCMHLFHSKCVVPWLQKSYSCPVCNTDASQALQRCD